MNYFHALVLGIVEGLTEFLPISSTFHLIITAKIIGLGASDFVKMFEVVIQSGAIFALLFVYLKTLISDKQLTLKVLYSFIPTAIVGFLLHKIIKTVFFESSSLMLFMFVAVGIVFIMVERYHLTLTKNITDLSIKHALIIGLAQSFSVIPGVSRAGAVIVIMMLLGYKRDESAKYTFLLSLPTIFAASALDLYQGRAMLPMLNDSYILIAIGFFSALFVAYFVSVWLIKYLSRNTLEIFGYYRLLIAFLLLVFKVLP
jgi:undecaprenyl-diphosphatase